MPSKGNRRKVKFCSTLESSVEKETHL
jgi:hypothetical protein